MHRQRPLPAGPAEGGRAGCGGRRPGARPARSPSSRAARWALRTRCRAAGQASRSTIRRLLQQHLGRRLSCLGHRLLRPPERTVPGGSDRPIRLEEACRRAIYRPVTSRCGSDPDDAGRAGPSRLRRRPDRRATPRRGGISTGFDPADLVELVAQSADPDLALAGLDRLAEVVPELRPRLAGSAGAGPPADHGARRQQQAQPASGRPSGPPGPAGAGADHDPGRGAAPWPADLGRGRSRCGAAGRRRADRGRAADRLPRSPAADRRPGPVRPGADRGDATASPTSCPTWPTPPWRRRWRSPGPSWVPTR